MRSTNSGTLCSVVRGLLNRKRVARLTRPRAYEKSYWTLTCPSRADVHCRVNLGALRPQGREFPPGPAAHAERVRLAGEDEVDQLVHHVERQLRAVDAGGKLLPGAGEHLRQPVETLGVDRGVAVEERVAPLNTMRRCSCCDRPGPAPAPSASTSRRMGAPRSDPSSDVLTDADAAARQARPWRRA
jgi:hypothetical protein